MNPLPPCGGGLRAKHGRPTPCPAGFVAGDASRGARGGRRGKDPPPPLRGRGGVGGLARVRVPVTLCDPSAPRAVDGKRSAAPHVQRGGVAGDASRGVRGARGAGGHPGSSPGQAWGRPIRRNSARAGRRLLREVRRRDGAIPIHGPHVRREASRDEMQRKAALVRQSPGCPLHASPTKVGVHGQVCDAARSCQVGARAKWFPASAVEAATGWLQAVPIHEPHVRRGGPQEELREARRLSAANRPNSCSLSRDGAASAMALERGPGLEPIDRPMPGGNQTLPATEHGRGAPPPLAPVRASHAWSLTMSKNET